MRACWPRPVGLGISSTGRACCGTRQPPHRPCPVCLRAASLLPGAPQASLIAEDLLKTNPESVQVLFNKFRSAIAFKPTLATVLSPTVSWQRLPAATQAGASGGGGASPWAAAQPPACSPRRALR